MEQHKESPVIQHVCKLCSEHFGTFDQLRKHSETHKKQATRQSIESLKRFVCLKCRSMFKTKEALREHEVQKHREEMQYECPKCGERFCQSDEMSKHLSTVHPASTTKNIIKFSSF